MFKYSLILQDFGRVEQTYGSKLPQYILKNQSSKLNFQIFPMLEELIFPIIIYLYPLSYKEQGILYTNLISLSSFS